MFKNVSGMLRRGPIWYSDGESVTPGEAPAAQGGNGATPVVQTTEAPPAPAARPVLSDEELRRMAGILAGEVPARSLQPAPLPPMGERAPVAPVRVVHPYDSLTLGALALRGALMLRAGKLKGDAETVFVRALREKIFKQRERDEAISDEALMHGAIRMIDDQVLTDWGRHLRSDEAMMSTYDGYGDQLVPTVLSSVLWYHFMLEAPVLNALQRFQMPSQPYDWPIVTGGPTIRAVAEIADQASFSLTASPIPVTKISTEKVTFSAGQIGAMVLGSKELFEDAGMSIANVWSTQLVRQMASAIDYVLVNGDESATATNVSHFGTDPTGTAYDKILVVDGLRHIAFANSDSAAQTAVSADSPTSLRELMGSRGRFGLYPRGLVIVCDPAVYYDYLALDAFESLSDMGPQATLLTGVVGSVKGVPLVVSEELEATNASGQIEDSHDSTLGSYLVVNTQNVLVGYRREVDMEMFPVPGTNGFAADITVRFDLQEMEAGQVGYGYNVGGA